ncbi:3-isopropylmalate dehydratase small subunit [Candidatus Carsonella ruddii]|uniref:3-isopropylmalate dehydratase small subunit n=1 Tax=Carsonella ruddii TaxID=114186 RepID=UPI003D81956C
MKLISNFLYIDIDNVDTDIIIPKQFLNTLKKNGFERCLFFDIRYIINKKNIYLNEDFSLNKKKIKILISGKNFGCGSSREHAVWAIKNFGIDIIIAESYSDIFFDNSMKNNLLLINFKKFKIETLVKNNLLYLNINKQFLRYKKNKYYYFYINSLYKNIFLNKFSIIDFILKKKRKF